MSVVRPFSVLSALRLQRSYFFLIRSYFLDPILSSLPCPQSSGKRKEPKPKLFGTVILRWGGGQKREGVGAKKFGMSLETRETKLFGWDIPGFCWDIPAVPPKFEKKKFVFNFWSLKVSHKRVFTLVRWQPGSANTGFCSIWAIFQPQISGVNSANTLLCDTLALSMALTGQTIAMVDAVLLVSPASPYLS